MLPLMRRIVPVAMGSGDRLVHSYALRLEDLHAAATVYVTLPTVRALVTPSGRE